MKYLFAFSAIVLAFIGNSGDRSRNNKSQIISLMDKRDDAERLFNASLTMRQIQLRNRVLKLGGSINALIIDSQEPAKVIK